MEETHAVTTSTSAGESTLDIRSQEFFASLLNEQSEKLRSLKHGDTMDGIILAVHDHELVIDIGAKSEGVVLARDMHTLTDEERSAIAVGATVLVYVLQPEDDQGRVSLSLDRARQERSWRKLQQFADDGVVLETKVINFNKGGLLVNLDGVRGFIPTSQVSGIGRGNEVQKQADMARMIGSTVRLKIVEMSRARNRLILSERQANAESRDSRKGALLSEIAVNDIREGTVTSVCDFGIFVDIGGADGLVHLSELSWSRVRHPSDAYKVGDSTKVMILNIDTEHRRIALSINRTQTEPWAAVAEAFSVILVVQGTVTQIAPFGAFVRLSEGVEGLIHSSELTGDAVAAVSEGAAVTVRIIRVDIPRRRIALSLQITPDAPVPDAS
ncbi:MAG: 30S ribosomal protein S1 [Roseiflexaceae bacterium]